MSISVSVNLSFLSIKKASHSSFMRCPIATRMHRTSHFPQSSVFSPLSNHAVDPLVKLTNMFFNVFFFFQSVGVSCEARPELHQESSL